MRAAIFYYKAVYGAVWKVLCDEAEEIDLNEIYRSIAEEAEYNYQRAEENSLRNAWQQDLIDLYRYER